MGEREESDLRRKEKGGERKDFEIESKCERGTETEKRKRRDGAEKG